MKKLIIFSVVLSSCGIEVKKIYNDWYYYDSFLRFRLPCKDATTQEPMKACLKAKAANEKFLNEWNKVND